MSENIPPTLAGAVSIDMNKLEAIFKVITSKLDDQGEKIKALEVRWAMLCGTLSKSHVHFRSTASATVPRRPIWIWR